VVRRYDVLCPFSSVQPVDCPSAVLGLVAPAGMLVNHTLCGARLSSSTKMTVVPAATVALWGEKFWPAPAPCGIVIVKVGPVLVEVVVDVEDEVVVLVDVVVLVLLVVDEVTAVPVTMSLPCIHPGWNWHS